MPVSISDLLSMLRDAGDLSLTFPIVENQRTFLGTNAENRIRVRPANVRSLVLGRSELDVLELALAERPDGYNAGSLNSKFKLERLMRCLRSR